MPPILPPKDGFLFLDREKFAASFASDLPAEQAAFIADSQVPWGVDALGGSITEPAWRIKPSWYRVATEDRMIPPPAQRVMSERAGSTVVEVSGSHAIYVSQPAAVAALIEQAAAPLPCAAVARRDGRFAVEWSRTPGWPVPQERLISGPPKVPHELGRFDCEVTGRHGKLQRRKLTDGVPPALSRGDSSDEVGQEAEGVVDPGDDPARPPG